MKKEISPNVIASINLCVPDLEAIGIFSLAGLFSIMKNEVPSSYGENTRLRLICHRIIKFIHKDLGDERILFYSCYYKGSTLKHLITDDRKEFIAYADKETED